MTVPPGAPVGPPEPAEHPRACPRCASPVAPGQDWCLVCGAAVSTRIEAPQAWRGPLVAMTGVLLLSIAALILAFFALADDDGTGGTVTAPAPTAPIPGTTPVPGAQETPTAGTTPTPTPSPTPTPDPEGAREPASWPAGRTAWTIVLNSTSSRAAARRRAERLAADGVPVGVLRSDDFRSLRAGFWVVFSGQYDSAPAAARAQRELGASAPAAAYVRRIVPR